MWRHVSLAFALVTAACTSDLDIRLGFEAPVRSAIVVTMDGNEASAWGLESGIYQYSHPVVGAIEIYLLEYKLSLSDLGLSEGEIALSSPSAGSVALPSADRVLLQTIIDGSAGELETLTELPERLMALRLHTGSIPECVDGGGCLVPRAGDSALICSTPCEESELPALPEAPAMVQLGPCAVGWVSVPPAGPDDIMECVPWVQAVECEPGSAQRPGEPCTVVGAACPVGPWPTDLEPGAAYFVDPTAASGGDGSQPAPYSSIAQVPLSTTATTVIALAKGSHAITTPFVGPVVLQGACALETQISTSLEFTQAPVVLRDVSLVGLSVSGAQVRLQGVIMAVVPPMSIAVMSGVLRADDIVVSGTLRFGLSVGGSARAQLSRARFDGLGIRAEDQSQLDLRTSVVVGGPVGLVVDRGAKAQLRAVAFEANTEFGFIVRGGGSELDVDQVVGRGGGGAGMSNGAALDGGKLTGRRLAFMGNASYGLNAGAGGIIELQDLLVRDTTPRAETPRLGMALSVSDGSMVTVLRAHWVRCMGYGAIVKNSVADFEDLTVTDVLGLLDSSHEWGYGVRAAGSAHVDLVRMRTRRVHGVGLSIETSVEMIGSDVEILEMLGRDEDGSYGRGIEVIDGSHLDLQRVRVHGAMNIGVHARNLGSNLEVRDLTITATGHSECFDFDCTLGGATGLSARESAAIRVDRFIIDSNANYGVRVADQAWLELRNGRISNHPIGAEVLVGTFDLSLLTRGIQYVDNAANLRLFTAQ